mmetsp:Transcript_7417/g.11911  ORF Transcript_7417/g.11911 Transcript_7417/m.11911 type:complete len:441 (+) Transcript_7417:2502-3824(+)
MGDAGRKHTVLMVCDFFWPSLGGVEMHIWSLSQCLLRQGHKVVVLTHAWDDRHGVRYMTNGLKVYYVPWVACFQNCSLPTFFPLLPLFREIVIREGIELVHGHQDSSAMMHEALFHAQTMGLGTCFTSHSLFNIYDTASLHLNKVLKFTLVGADHCIAVSYTCKENMIVRTGVSSEMISTIPNAVDPSSFTPDPSLRDPLPRINIVIINRLAYRKGADLVVQVIPVICKKFKNVHFIIGGDGPKRLLFDEMRERYELQDQVELLGGVPHAQVRNVLCRGSIFLNCSLTESFCMAILEAACCGLYVISTRVGGIPEVLPPDMVKFAETPTPGAIIESVESAIEQHLVNRVDPYEQHNRVSKMYDWNNVAERVVKVYTKVKARSAEKEGNTWETKFQRYQAVGPIAGVMSVFLIIFDSILLWALEWFRPASAIERAPSLKCL